MKTYTLVGLGLMIILLLCLTGCEGVSGPRGETGDDGNTGQSWQAQPPENRFFSLAVCNGSILSHNGAPKLYLAFDGEHSNAGDTIVSVKLADGQVPSIDGVDEGESGWGDQPTTVALEKVAGSDNFIADATVRSAYDESFVYFQVQWTENDVPESGITAGLSNIAPFWWTTADFDTLNSLQERSDSWALDSGDEDWLLLLFEVAEVRWFDHDGCFVTCHAGAGETSFHRTNGVRERMDFWAWSAGQAGHLGFAEDGYIDADNVPILSTSWDHGTPPRRSNFQSVRFEVGDDDVLVELPEYQHMNDPNYNTPFPMWDYEITTMDVLADWRALSTVPFYFVSIPFGSAADVAAFGLFDGSTNTWTVELKRARRTGNGDDAQF